MSISKDAKIKAIDEFVIANVEMARSLIRKNLLGRNTLTLKKSSMLTVRTDVNDLPSHYKKKEIIKGNQQRVKTVYVGKKGDVIFTLSFSANSNEVVEIKLHDAVNLLDGFMEYTEDIFGDKIGEMAKHHQAENDRREMQAVFAAQEKVEQAAKAKAAKYNGKVAYGAW